jgi:hypothetical protein
MISLILHTLGTPERPAVPIRKIRKNGGENVAKDSLNTTVVGENLPHG